MPSNFPVLALAAAILIGSGQTARAAPLPSARLVRCDGQSCLLVKGHRASPAAPVHINGHAVATSGGHTWRARVPVETVRGWSEPFARTISVSVADTTADADLPIGLLGHTDLAMITIRRK